MEFKIVLGADQALLDCINGLTAALVGKQELIIKQGGTTATFVNNKAAEGIVLPTVPTIPVEKVAEIVEETKEVSKRTRRTKEQMMGELQAEQKELEVQQLEAKESFEDSAYQVVDKMGLSAEFVKEVLEEAEQEVEEVVEEESTEEIPEITPERMRAQITRLDELGKRDMVKAKLTEFGANKQSELTGKQRFDFYTALTKIK